MPLLRGDVIRRRRRELGIKVGAFALKVECSRSHLINVENGGRPASVELAYRIARQLDVDVDELTVEDGAR